MAAAERQRGGVDVLICWSTFCSGDALRGVSDAAGHAGLTWAAQQLGAEGGTVGSTTKALVVLPAEEDGSADAKGLWHPLRQVRLQYPALFIVAFGSCIAESAVRRLRAFDSGARMVSDNVPHLLQALLMVARQGRGGGRLVCPQCDLGGLTEDELHFHHTLYHSAEDNDTFECPVCGDLEDNFALHLHNCHGPLEAREPTPAPYAVFSWVVCRREDGRFLMVNEPAGISGGLPRYWLPAGRVDVGESPLEAARRETLEEGGVAIRVTGILRFMLTGLARTRPCPRVVFLASPLDNNAPAKSLPDWESAGAMWVDVDGLRALTKDDWLALALGSSQVGGCLGRRGHARARCTAPRQDDYRSPDPAVLFPDVASGALQPLSCETPAFAQFEDVIRGLTRGSKSVNDLFQAWGTLKGTYPQRAFVER